MGETRGEIPGCMGQNGASPGRPSEVTGFRKRTTENTRLHELTHVLPSKLEVRDQVAKGP